VPTDPVLTPPSISNQRRILVWIAVFKLCKSAISLSAAIATLDLLHRDLTELVLRLIYRLHLEPDGKASAWLLARVLHLDEKRLRLITIAFFVYSALYLVEGVGLYLQKLWAEWLTVVTTSILLPLEVYELVLHPSAMKVALIVVNVVVIAYLVWRLKTRDTKPGAASEAEQKASADDHLPSPNSGS
jgi:uncharacterized membrane protein (DUF2068 family)